ncbi:ECF transporter S component [Levilactobacillus huananensis]|uniref:ECF transporter S component n=1 Tax=Levilactobacillus huananensis TaxID=2486019 RepID=UPI000F78AAD8|nr:ECF transporter S component [Levilactobacillus huananensis]
MTREKTFRLVVDALLMAIVLLQNIVPFLGYVPLGPFSMTLIGLTVIVAGMALDVRDGALIGGFWGLITFVRAFAWPSSPVAPLIFTNPLISIVPRLLMGVAAGLVFRWARQRWSMRGAMRLAAATGAVINSGLVLGLVYVFYQTPAVATAFGAHGSQTLGYVLLISVATNAVPELILDVLVAPLLAEPLRRRWDRVAVSK